jgi:hypothetical protein
MVQTLLKEAAQNESKLGEFSGTFLNNADGQAHAIFENNRAQESVEEDNSTVIGNVPNLNSLHKENSLENSASSQTNNKSAIEKNFLEKYIKDPNSRNIAISTINAILHGLATVTSFGDGEQMKSVNKIFNSGAFLFTRWLGPLITYGSAALNALKKNDFAEMFIKLIPPVLLPFTGDANVDTVYGLSSALNQPYDMASKRVRENAHKSKAHLDFANNKGDFSTNLKLIFDSYKSLYKDLVAGKLNPWKEATHLIGCPLIMLSSLPIMLFARSDRDSNFSRVLGLFRNIGGMLGDVGFMAGDNIYKKSIGVLFLTAAMSSIAKRWVDEKTSRIFIHLSSALDLTAYSIWNAFSESIEKVSSKVKTKTNLALA